MLSVILLESCLFPSSIKLWYSLLMIHLGWVGTCLHHVMTTKPVTLRLYDHLFILLVISLYAFINNVLSLCMIMAIIALLVGRFQSFASLHLYWAGMLLVHPTPKSQTCHLCPPYLPICGISPPLQVNLSCATFKTFKNITPCFVYFIAHEKVVCKLLW